MASENPFWDFSVNTYSRNGVAPASLRLQDRLGADVNIVMYCCWVAHDRGVRFDLSALNRLVLIVGPWKSAVVEPLRMIRRTLKGTVHDGFDTGERERLRTEIKRLELRSERLQQDALFATTAPISETSASPDKRRNKARANVGLYLGTLQRPSEDADRSDVQLIVNAAFDN